MKNFKRFSEYLAEQKKLSEVKIEDRVFLNHTGKGFENGHYIGKHCRWRDDKDAFSGFGKPSPVKIELPDGISAVKRQDAIMLAKKNTGKVDIPGFAEIIVSKDSLMHGTRMFASRDRLKNLARTLNFAIIPYAKEILKASVPVSFSPADDNDRGKPVKGIVWLDGLVDVKGLGVFPVRSTIQVSANCDFRKETDNENFEIYALHSMKVETKSETDSSGSL